MTPHKLAATKSRAPEVTTCTERLPCVSVLGEAAHPTPQRLMSARLCDVTKETVTQLGRTRSRFG